MLNTCDDGVVSGHSVLYRPKFDLLVLQIALI